MPSHADLIAAFLKEQKIATNPKPSTLATRRRYLVVFLNSLPKNIEECTTDEIRYALAEYRDSHAQGTARMMVIYVSMLLRFLGRSRECVDAIDTMKPKTPSTKKRASDMLTYEEVGRIIQAADNFRDRALVAVMYEGGLRPIECSCMKWSDIKFDEYGAVLNTSEKTGKPRYVRLISSAVALKELRTRENGDGPVFPPENRSHPPGARTHGLQEVSGISPHRINDLVQELGARAGIKKRCHAHLLRHSRITHMMEDKIPESIIKLQHWGSLSSPMLSSYAHVSNTFIDETLLEHAGIKPEKGNKKPSIKPIQCESCKTINLPGSKLCSSCGCPFTDEVRTEYEMAKRLLLDPQSLREYADFLERKKKEGD